MLLVNDFLEESAARHPGKLALVCGKERLTYGEIDEMANRLARALRQRGVYRGERVVFFLPNSVELAVGLFATLKAGGVFVVVNAGVKQDKLMFVVDNCQATVMFCGAMHAELATTMMRRVSSLKAAILVGTPPPGAACTGDGLFDYQTLLQQHPNRLLPRTCIDRDLACLIYTSGSTGDPKGVMSDHSNVVFAASSIIAYLENQSDDIVMCALPLSFDYGLYQLLMVFKFGGTLVLERSFAYPVQILKRVEQEKVTGFPGVPTMFAMLLQIDLSEYDLSSLRYFTNTAAALPPTHIQKIREMFSWATLYSMYGLTETKRTLYLPPDQLDKRPDSVGIAIPGTEVWIEDEEGNRLGPNQVGELVIRGRHVMRGYWQNPEATAKRYRPGPLPGERVCYSGDLFRMDDEGYMYFVGRSDDIIKSRGEKVAPKEVENVLYGIPGVVKAAVIGVPDPILGESIKALVVSSDSSLTKQDVLRYCRAHLENFMVPQIVEFRKSLPLTSSGKIKKAGLS